MTKNITKIMAIVGVIAIAFLLSGFVTKSTANEENDKILTMRVIEAIGSLGSFIVIVDEDGKQETIELDKIATKKDPFINNLVKINNTLNNITDNGYRLLSTSGGSGDAVIITTYTFVKE